jgi:hypothetical protein
VVSGILPPGAGQEIGGDADRMGAADDPAEEARSCGEMQPGLGAFGKLPDDIGHIGAGCRQRVVESGEASGIIMPGHMADRGALTKPGRKPGGFLKQRCDC